MTKKYCDICNQKIKEGKPYFRFGGFWEGPQKEEPLRHVSYDICQECGLEIKEFIEKNTLRKIKL